MKTLASNLSRWGPGLLIALILIASALILNSRGMVWWCRWDTPLWLFSGGLISTDVWSKHNSQHLLDPYAFSHFQHGLLFFWGLNALLGKRLSVGYLLVLAVGIEAGWELLENSPTIIDQYRENTASLEYYGDSILNSFGDVLACMVGFWAALKLKFRHGLLLFVLIEVVMVLAIRDSLLINILMLTYPLEAIKAWQMSGAGL